MRDPKLCLEYKQAYEKSIEIMQIVDRSYLMISRALEILNEIKNTRGIRFRTNVSIVREEMTKVLDHLKNLKNSTLSLSSDLILDSIDAECIDIKFRVE